jgi:steroid 5-alpha reductase family enzyme
MPEASFHLLLEGWLIIAGMMLVLWVIHLFTKNAAIVDVGWAIGFPILAVFYALMGDGFSVRKWLLVALTLFWGGRLAFYLLTTRVLGKVTEDARYAQLRQNWGGAIPFKFLLMFQFQALLVAFLSTPFLMPMLNIDPSLSPGEVVGVLVWFAAIYGEWLADHQLHRFKSNPGHKGQVCDVGLWRYSRHPNYFFEWLIWCTYALYAFSSPWGFAALLSPVVMLFMLLKVSGVPLAEAQSLKSKPEAYRRYQQTTSVFIPWFPLKGEKRER